MAEAGYPIEARLGFDKAIVRAARTLARMAAETVDALVPAAKKPPRGKVWGRKPRYSEEELLAAYGVGDGDEAEVRDLAQAAIDRYRPADFGGDEWGDDEPDGEGDGMNAPEVSS